MEIEELDDNDMSGVDELVDYLKKHLPKDRILMLNMPRYMEAVKSVNKVLNIIRRETPEAKQEVKFDNLTGSSLCATFETDMLNIYNMKEFNDAIKCATTLAFEPLANGNLYIGLTYENAMVPVPPSDEKPS